MGTSTAEAARRCIEDRGFAQTVLAGEAGDDEVRRALLADLEAHSEVTGFLVVIATTNEGTAGTGGGGGSGKVVDISELPWGQITFPNLLACCSGQHFG